MDKPRTLNQVRNERAKKWINDLLESEDDLGGDDELSFIIGFDACRDHMTKEIVQPLVDELNKIKRADRKSEYPPFGAREALKYHYERIKD